jgi:hypothetical protein
MAFDAAEDFELQSLCKQRRLRATNLLSEFDGEKKKQRVSSFGFFVSHLWFWCMT